MKAATVDGRPVIWQNMDWSDHRVVLRKHTASSGQYDAMEIVKYGASIGWNALNSQGVGHVVNKLADFGSNGNLGAILINIQRKSATIDAFQRYLDSRGAQTVGENFLVMDGSGRIVDFEIGPTYYFPYDPQNSTRQQQSFFQSPKLFVTRGNSPFKNTQHKELDSVVDTWSYDSSRFRYRTAREQFIKRITNGNKLTVEEMMGIARWGNPGYDTHTISRPDKGKTGYSIWSTIMLGVKTAENPRYATMLVSLGLPDYGIFIPVWVDLSQTELSNNVKTWDAKNIAWWSYKLFEQRFDDTEDYDNYLNKVFASLQSNIITAVKAARVNWLVHGNTSRSHNEARLLHDWSAKAAFETIKSAYDTAGSGGRGCNRPPDIVSLSPANSGLTVSFHCDAKDPDGNGVVEYFWDFGDGHTTGSTVDATQTHSYGQAGTYLVGCYARDGRSSPAANVKFDYITVIEQEPDAGIADAAVDQGALDGGVVDTGQPADAGHTADVGVPVDAGHTGSTADAGADGNADTQGRVQPDAGQAQLDAIQARPDAGAGPAGHSLSAPIQLSGGCALATASTSPAPELPVLVAALALLALWHRRRSRQ